eukprot:Sdes_comp18818_c0_seq2m9231
MKKKETMFIGFQCHLIVEKFSPSHEKLLSRTKLKPSEVELKECGEDFLVSLKNCAGKCGSKEQSVLKISRFKWLGRFSLPNKNQHSPMILKPPAAQIIHISNWMAATLANALFHRLLGGKLLKNVFNIALQKSSENPKGRNKEKRTGYQFLGVNLNRF